MTKYAFFQLNLHGPSHPTCLTCRKTLRLYPLVKKKNRFCPILLDISSGLECFWMNESTFKHFKTTKGEGCAFPHPRLNIDAACFVANRGGTSVCTLPPPPCRSSLSSSVVAACNHLRGSVLFQTAERCIYLCDAPPPRHKQQHVAHTCSPGRSSGCNVSTRA